MSLAPRTHHVEPNLKYEYHLQQDRREMTCAPANQPVALARPQNRQRVKRHAIALWQNNGTVDLIDETGADMGRPSFVVGNSLPLVTGEGANLAAAELINQMSAIPELQKRVTAAARVGARRWNLYLDNGVKLALPEEGAAEAMKTAWDLDQTQGVFSKAVALIDLRLQGQVGFQVAELDSAQKPAVHH